MLIFLDALPNFKNIRADPRYADLLRRIGLPQRRPRHSDPERSQG